MRIKSILAAIFVAALALVSCNNENNETAASGKTGMAYVKITTPEINNTRAIGENSNGTALTLLGGKIMWSDMHGTITRVVTVVADATYDAATADAQKGMVKITALAAGATVKEVMEDSKECTFVGPHSATGTAVSVGAKIADVRSAYFGVSSMLDAANKGVANVPIYGADTDGLTVSGTGDAKTVSAVFEVKAIGSRIQIGAITGGETVKSFKIAGIWVNNFFSKMPYSQTLAAADLVNNKDVESKYDNITYGGYIAALADFTSFGSLKTWKPVNNDVTKFWAYNVFPNNGFGRTELPHIIVKLTDLVDVNDGAHGTKWITVKGYADNNIAIENILPGVSYTFDAATGGLKFEIDDVKEKPEMGAIIGNVKITTIPWTDKVVTPEF